MPGLKDDPLWPFPVSLMWLGESGLSPGQIYSHWAIAQFPKHPYFAVLGRQTKASCMLGKCSITGLNPLIKAHFANSVPWVCFCFSHAVIKPRASHMLGRYSSLTHVATEAFLLSSLWLLVPFWETVADPRFLRFILVCSSNNVSFTSCIYIFDTFWVNVVTYSKCPI